jgi:tetratricopeptide (TPR) repeat protein
MMRGHWKMLLVGIVMSSATGFGMTKEDIKDTNVLYHVMFAEFLIQDHQYAGAYLQYRKVLDDAHDTELLERAYKVAVASKKPAYIEEAARKYLRYNPDDEQANYKYVLILVELLEKRKAQKHLQHLLSAKYFDKKGALLRFVHTMAFARQREDAEKMVRQTIDKVGENAKSLYALAVFYQLRKESDQALATVDRSINMDSSFADSNILKVRILLTQKKTDEAVALMDDYYQHHYSEKTAELYAQLLFENKRYARTADVYQRLLKSDKNKPDWLDGLGAAQVNLKRYEEAYATYQKLVTSEDYGYKARYLMGLIDQESGRPKQALDQFSRVSSLSPHYYDAQLAMAEIVGKDDLGAGIALINGLSSSNEEQQYDLVVARASLYEHHQNYAKAYEVFSDEITRSAAQEEDFNANLYYSRALMAEKLGKLDLMEQDFLYIIKQEPENYDALNALGFTLADRTTRYPEALKYIEAALKLESSKFYILDSMGWVKYKMGEIELAISYLEKAYKIKADAEVAAHLAEVLWHQGNKPEARKYLKSASDLDAAHPAVIRLKNTIGMN